MTLLKRPRYATTLGPFISRQVPSAHIKLLKTIGICLAHSQGNLQPTKEGGAGGSDPGVHGEAYCSVGSAVYLCILSATNIVHSTLPGDVRRALHYHQVELSLSEAGRDRLGAAIAHRMVGECECELGNYDTAVQHQTKHLKIAQGLGQCTLVLVEL